jgi:hypothetical protein
MNSIKNFLRASAQPAATAVLCAVLVLAGLNLFLLPALAETQAEGRGGNPARFNSPVQMLVGATVDNGLTVNTGGLTVNAGTTSIAGALNMNAQTISNIGNAGTDFAANGGLTLANALTVTTGGAAISGTVALDAGEIGAAEIANVSRAVNVPLLSLLECSTDAGALLAVTDGTDAHPYLANSATNGLGYVLSFDDTGATPDTDYVCGNLTVPPDYASGGAFALRVLKDAETGANTEVINCAGSINGAALGTAGTVTVTGATTQAVTCTPTLTSLAAGNSVSFEFHITSGGTVDDTVNIASIEFTYTATE